MIKWLENNVPYSQEYDDTFYTRSDGRAESEHVFIKGNNLLNRWTSCQSMTIGELGFGTGLNFLETVRQWQTGSHKCSQLHYISFEQTLLSNQAITRALSQWPDLEELSVRFCNFWNPDTRMHNLSFTPGVKLTILSGDANHTLPLLEHSVDAWYLDGFSPAKNPQLWNPTLMQQVYNHTSHAGTFATYTVAGFVRRNLQQAGFEITRQTGFGSKREMLVGCKP